MEKDKVQLGRRDFFKKAGLSVGVAAAASVVASGPAAAAESASSDKVTAGYRETDHVRSYYELAAF